MISLDLICISGQLTFDANLAPSVRLLQGGKLVVLNGIDERHFDVFWERWSGGSWIDLESLC